MQEGVFPKQAQIGLFAVVQAAGSAKHEEVDEPCSPRRGAAPFRSVRQYSFFTSQAASPQVNGVGLAATVRWEGPGCRASQTESCSPPVASRWEEFGVRLSSHNWR